MGYQFDFAALAQYFGLFVAGAAVTAGLTAVAAIAGVGLGIAGAAASLSHRHWLRASVLAYVELIRNTPFIVQMFFLFFGLPSLGLRLTALEAAALAMTINLAAYAIEILRAGLEAVPSGQIEAGRAFALPPVALFSRIVLPQALAIVFPALVGQIVVTMLESAVVSQIAVVDLTHVADLIQSRNFRPFETYLVVTGIYLAMAMALRRGLEISGSWLFAGRAR